MSVQLTPAALLVTRDAEPMLVLRLTSCGDPTVIEISGEVDLSTAHLVIELVEHVASLA